jgi:hypothetical protein
MAMWAMSIENVMAQSKIPWPNTMYHLKKYIPALKSKEFAYFSMHHFGGFNVSKM